VRKGADWYRIVNDVQFVVVGNDGVILTSQDGITWTPQTSGVTTTLRKACYGDGTWGVVGDNGVILTSQDGITWTPRTSGVTSILIGIAYHNNVFAACGYHYGIIITSTNNGISWSTSVFNYNYKIMDIRYANGMFVSITSVVLYSYDGINWSSLNPGNGNSQCYALNYGNGKWIFGTSRMFSAPGNDFTQWTEIQSLGNSDTWHDALYSNGKWYIVGRDSANYARMMTSIDDGQTWVNVPFSFRTFNGIAKRTVV
jgi:photosystem II stability/assembly factor-like uncharacterized protein